ncbi:MAG: LCP family protein [Agathobacter sp.]|nr:LCP family protein [Agathobacter sp.]
MKNNKMKSVFIGVLAVLLVLLGVMIGVSMTNDKDGNNKDNTESVGNDTQTTEEDDKQVYVPSTQTEVEEADGQETFVIFGVDSRTNQLGKGTRSDSIMIVHVNHDEKTVKVASVFRDCMVHIEGHKFEKITHAHSYGGPQLALSTVNENFDLNATNYVTVNFNNVADLVDDIGGIEYYITDEEAGHLGFSGAGTYLLDGKEVVTYSRIRKAAGGDYKRSERQREMLFKIFEKAKDLPTGERIELVDEMLGEINTSYKQDEIVELLYHLSKYEIVAMDAFPKVFYGGSVEGAWVEVPCTLVDMNAAIHEFLFGTTDYVPSEKVKEYSDILRNKVSGPNNDFRD